MVDQVIKCLLFQIPYPVKWLIISINFHFQNSINRLSMENVRDLLNLMKQNGIQISMSSEDIAEKYNTKIVFKPGKI